MRGEKQPRIGPRGVAAASGPSCPVAHSRTTDALNRNEDVGPVHRVASRSETTEGIIFQIFDRRIGYVEAG